jgi:hypothetical protein
VFDRRLYPVFVAEILYLLLKLLHTPSLHRSLF